jgi:hypothetical protein
MGARHGNMSETITDGVNEMIYERKKDCPLVESIIWDKVARDWGGFAGIEKFEFAELLALRSAIDHQLDRTVIEVEE